MICEKGIRMYCCEEASKIENYDKAVADTTQTWECHHRLETHNSDGERRPVDLTYKELIALDMYYHRPASELTLLTSKEHNRLHGRGKKLGSPSEETKRRISEALKGRTFSEGHKRKMSESLKGKLAWNKGKPCTEEQKRKISEANKGRTFSEEVKRKMSDVKKGKKFSEGHKRKMSEVVKTVSTAYKEYKANGGKLSWNSFRKFYAKRAI